MGSKCGDLWIHFDFYGKNGKCETLFVCFFFMFFACQYLSVPLATISISNHQNNSTFYKTSSCASLFLKYTSMSSASGTY